MGVPSFYRWVSTRYPKVISPAIANEATVVDGVELPPNYSAPNPNGELDNLYLDMNGIVHPCTHPEGRPAPETEQDMMLEVFRYTDSVVSLARPRKVLVMAVDGVAPRAKMNQQRSRRFRSAQDAETELHKREAEAALAVKRGEAIATAIVEKKWDTNVITPGTPFMDMLGRALRYWVAYKLNSDPGWAQLKVVISDASVPGEGEHKLMELIRAERNDPQHDPNTSHCIFGLDADLIFLGLATHEPHFRILREDVFNQNKSDKKGYIWLDVGVLRQYLEIELDVPGVPFAFDLERAIDDWVFMAFFCGNDFLPHLPSLDVRENGIEVVCRAWRRALPVLGGYMTLDGDVILSRVQTVLEGVAAQEDGIFQQKWQQEQRRQTNEQGRIQRQAERQSMKRQRRENTQTGPTPGIPLFTVDGQEVDVPPAEVPPVDAKAGQRRPFSQISEAPADNVRLYEPGYRERYYEAKFGVAQHDPEGKRIKRDMVQKYIEGVCWTLRYYYRGCPSWTWYYPYHYAPFAQDMVDVDLRTLEIKFEPNTRPFLPFEQLMSVLPAASSHSLPEVFRPLMSDPDSPIIDFYPAEFPIDMNGKKMAWQGIALLPFIDEARLLAAVQSKYGQLTAAELARNARGLPCLLVGGESPLAPHFDQLYAGAAESFDFRSTLSHGLAGKATRSPQWAPHRPLVSPVPSVDYPDLDFDTSWLVDFHIDEDQGHKSMLLQGFRECDLILSQDDVADIRRRRAKSDRGDDRPEWRRQQQTDDRDLVRRRRPRRSGGYLAFVDAQEQQAKQQAFEANQPTYNAPGYSGYQTQGYQNYQRQQNYSGSQNGGQRFQGYTGAH